MHALPEPAQPIIGADSRFPWISETGTEEIPVFAFLLHGAILDHAMGGGAPEN